MFVGEAYIGGALLEASKEVLEGLVIILSEVFKLSIYTSLFIAISILVVKLVKAFLGR